MIKALSFLLISSYVLSAYAEYNLTTPWRILGSSELKKTDGYIMKKVQGCEVHMTKHPTGHIQLFWQRGPVSVFIHAVADEIVYQDWNFGDTHIHVEMTDKILKSTWKFSPSMEVEVVYDLLDAPTNGDSKSNDENKTPENPKITWKNANEQDESKIKTYYKYMEQWCENNKAFIAFESCAIAYESEETQTEETQSNGMPNDKTPANGTPSNGSPTNETPTNGTPNDATPTNGTSTNGTSTNGTPTNGTSTNGTSTNGTPTNGTPPDSTPTNG